MPEPLPPQRLEQIRASVEPCAIGNACDSPHSGQHACEAWELLAEVDRLTAERDKAVAEVWEYRRQPPDQTAVKLLGRLDAAVAERNDARDRADELERWSDSIAALAPDEFDDGTGRSQESLISAWIGHVLARLDEADENLRRVLALADRYEAQGRARSSTAVADELRAAVQGDRPAETSAEGQIGREARREIVGSGADHFGCAEAGHGTATPASSSAEPIEDLIERSSLGTPEAKRQRPEPAVDRPKRITSRDVDCPTCGATAGERCRGSAYSSRSHRAVDYHHARREAARSLSARTFAEEVTPDAD